MRDRVNIMNTFIHETAEVSEFAQIGEGSKIWNQAQIREGAKIGRGCIIGKNAYIDKDVVIGDNCKIQNNVNVYDGVVIENDVFCGPSMTFTNDMYPRAFNQDWKIVSTLVKKGASIGANATIVCGVTIGEYALVGAGSVVCNDVKSYSMVIGNPARMAGYVCKCGNKMIFENDRAICNVCGKEYLYIDDIIKEYF